MKNLVKLIGIIAIIAVIGFSMAACDGDDDPGNGTGNAPSTSGELTITALGDFNGKWVFAEQVFEDGGLAIEYCSCEGDDNDCSCETPYCGCEGCANNTYHAFYEPEPEPTTFLFAGGNININQQTGTFTGVQVSGGQAKLKVWSVNTNTNAISNYNGNDKKVEMWVIILNKPSITIEETNEYDDGIEYAPWFGGMGGLEADFTAGKATAAFTTWGDD
jgi:hypothetical protein